MYQVDADEGITLARYVLQMYRDGYVILSRDHYQQLTKQESKEFNVPDTSLPEDNTSEWIGRIAYSAYCRAVDDLTWDGRPTPEWNALTDKIRGAWVAAGMSARNYGEQQCLTTKKWPSCF
jgi:hypothetical protein